MKLDHFIISVILVSLFIVAGFFVIADINSKYATANITDSRFSGLQAQAESHLNTSYAISKSMEDKTFGEDITTTDAIGSLVKGSFSAVRQIANTFGMLFSMIADLASALGVPAFFVTALISIVVVLVIFAVILLFMRATV